MRTYYRSLSEVLASPIVEEARTFHSKEHRQNRVLKSTRLEDMVFQELHEDDEGLTALERVCKEKLQSFPELSRDIYQSVYSFQVRKRGVEEQSTLAQKFNAPIIQEIMDSDDYPTIRAACEGRQLPAYEAAKEFIFHIADDLDGLLERVGGQKRTLDTLEKLEKKRDQSMGRLKELTEQYERCASDPELEKKMLSAANHAKSQCSQVAAVARMVQANTQKNKADITALVARAAASAVQKAEETQLALMSWGVGPEEDTAQSMAADLELVNRVRQSSVLTEIARHLGRLKDLVAGKRKNGYAYGRGEKYTLELGANLNQVISSEFALLAMPETIPLFLRKLQNKSLKQYQRREPVSKGYGDIICMLDESASAKDQAPWCKAVALALLAAAMQDGRRFAMIHFAGENHFQTDRFLPGQFNREDILQAAELFLSGGTSYATPLKEALRLMEEEGFQNADMLFITDGKCALPPDFLKHLDQEKAQRGFRITGVLLDQDDEGFAFSLAPFCEKILRTSQLAQEQIEDELMAVVC